MPAEDVQVYGSSGPMVLLLPGGAESCDGFFPGLVEGLVGIPVVASSSTIVPGTGTSSRPGTLAGASTDINSLIGDLGCGPTVIVGQSLGGAVALLLAVDHPEVVAGLVLLDPTPINDPRTCARLERVMKVMGRLASVPLVGGALQALLRGGNRRSMRRIDLRPDCRAALEKIGEVDVARLDAAVHGITDCPRTSARTGCLGAGRPGHRRSITQGSDRARPCPVGRRARRADRDLGGRNAQRPTRSSRRDSRRRS